MLLKEYIKKNSGCCTVFIDPAYADSPLSEGLEQGLATLHQYFELQKIDSSHFAAVHRFQTPLPNAETFYFKQYFYRSAWDFIKHIFRRCRAVRALIAADMLRRNGFNTPDVIAAGRQTFYGFCRTSFLLTRELPDALPADDFFRHFIQFADPVVRRRFLRAFGEYIGRLHRAGISHGDLRIRNIMIARLGHGFEFFLLDNERTIRHRTLPWRLRVKNLVDLSLRTTPVLTRSDYMRFFLAYIAQNPQCHPAKLFHEVAFSSGIRTEILRSRI